LELITQDLQTTLAKQSTVVKQLEEERSHLQTALKETLWSKDQEGKRYQRELTQLKQSHVEQLEDSRKQLESWKQEV